MTGTIINVAAILVGGTLGCVLGARLQDRIRQAVMAVLGLFTLGYGLQMFLKTGNALVVLGSLMVGVLLGEWWRIEDGLQGIGKWVEARFTRSGDEGHQARFVRGFLTTALIFCIGPMAILGSIQDGLLGDYQLLAIKAVLDGFAAFAFASSLGAGVLFSAAVVLIYQGGLSLLAAQAQSIFSTSMMNEMNATGGVILMALSIGSLLELKPIRAANMLPALVLAPMIIAILALLH